MGNDAGTGLTLYGYWRSSAAYRVRIALNLKGLEYTQRPVDLVRDGGEQHRRSYREVNPQRLVPALLHDGRVLTQSLAICAYLDEVFPSPPLLPERAADRATVRAMAQIIACDIHPLNNLRVQQYLKSHLSVSEADALAWMRHWMSAGFTALERLLQTNPATGRCCWGDEPGLADCCLIPQVYNAERFGCKMSGFPLINAITAYCRSLPAFKAAEPARQPDAPPRGSGEKT